MGPNRRPPVVAHAQMYMSHTRCLMLNISSILPETMIEGTADVNPEMKRPTTAPATDGVNPTTKHDTQ